MHVENNVTNRYYTPYKTNQNAGYFAGYMQTADGQWIENQKTAEEGFIEKFVDYQEFHREWMSQPNTDYYFGHSYAAPKIKAAADSGLSSAVETAEGKGTGKFLGLTAIPGSGMNSYGMAAFCSEKSTSEDPVIRVSSNCDGKPCYYDVHVKEVNPRNASCLEMFALSCYLDEQGITDRGTFGTYNRMKAHAGNASYIGQGYDLQDSDNVGMKMDWVAMLQLMAQNYLGNTQMYSQYLDCEKLADELEKWTDGGKN